VQVIGEHHTVTDEYAIFERHALTHERVARNLALPTDDGVLLDLDKRANFRTGPNPAAIEVHEIGLKDTNVFFEGHRRRDHRGCNPLFSGLSLIEQGHGHRTSVGKRQLTS
jgi:hypothetical protein